MTKEELEMFIAPLTTAPPMDEDLSRPSGLLEET